ncbi:class I SAM-dependent methyltransferase [Candidatus Amarolinea aalborgensis]|jgi:SAM-dependent methyltransferase|uniref:class I SAM-dependent methyltransferase n=1 Tax=Candidatus Amarolinea aalborgensis TaxID=2249329 RepID=UPI003BF9C143
MTTPPVAQATDSRLNKERVKFGGPSLTGLVRPADAHVVSSPDCATRVQQPFHRLASLVQHIESRLAAARSSDQQAILAQHRRAMLDAMHDLGGAIQAFLDRSPGEAETQAAREWVVPPIRAWSATGPFFHHAFAKPRGYPGDFETIEIIYDCCPRADDLPGLIFDDYYLHARPAQAVRNRLAYLVDKLAAEVHRRTVAGIQPVRLLSLGSGPARELALLSGYPGCAQAVEVTCLDMDGAALTYAHQRINGRLNGQVQFVHDNALRYARGANRPAQPFDVIYAAGLFDYLNADLAARLIEDCHGMLAPGGTLIVGNFSTETHPNDRVLVDWLLDWPLLYRDEQAYRRIFARTSFGVAGLRFEFEPLRANLFAVAQLV